MPIQSKLNLEYTSYRMTLRETAKEIYRLQNDLEHAQTFVYNLEGSMPKNEYIWDLVHELQCHLMLQNFKDIVNEQRSEYKNGDLWILADNKEMQNKIIEDLYEELERQFSD